MRKKLDQNAKLYGRSLHAEILLRLEASLGESKFGLSEKINNLGEKTEYVTRTEVEQIIREALRDAGVS